MSNISALFKLQIEEKMDMFRTKNKKVMIKSIVKCLLLVVVAVLVIFFLTKQMHLMGIKFNLQLLSIVILATQAVSLILCLGSIISTLYMSKDNEILMSMPVTHNEVFLSKIIVLYIKETISNALFSLPIFITFAVLGNFGALFYVSIPFMLVVLPLFPLALAAFLSIPICIAINYLKNHFVLMIIVIVVLAGTAIFGYMYLVTGLTSVIDITGQQIETVRKVNAFIDKFARYNWLYLKTAEAMVFSGFVWKFPMLLGINAALFAGGVLLVKPFFFKTAMKSAETGEKQFRKVGVFKVESESVSLMKKEALTVFRSPGYIFQYFIFTLLMPFIVVVYDRFLMSITVSQVGVTMIDGAHVLVVAILAMFTNIISASAISREGGNFYLMKVCPISYKKQAYIKIAFNAAFTCLAILVTCIISGIVFQFDWWKVILTFLIVSIASIGHICHCFKMDLVQPSLDWYDNSEISTISKSTTKGMIYGLILAIVLAFSMMWRSTFAVWQAWTLVGVLSLAYAAYAVYTMHIRLNYYFKSMEI